MTLDLETLTLAKEDELDALAVAQAMADPRPSIPLGDLLVRYADELAEGVDTDG